MKFIKEFFKWFVIINTGVLLIFTINVIKYDYIQPVYLWEIFAASAVTSLITTIVFSINPSKVIPVYARILLGMVHFLSLLAVMLFFGNSFGWITLDVKGVITMTLSVAGVYLCTAVLSYILGMQEAKKLNEALNKYNEE